MCAIGNKRPAQLYSLLDKQLFHNPSASESRITGFDHSFHWEIHGKLKQSEVLCDQISIHSTFSRQHSLWRSEATAKREDIALSSLVIEFCPKNMIMCVFWVSQEYSNWSFKSLLPEMGEKQYQKVAFFGAEML